MRSEFGNSSQEIEMTKSSSHPFERIGLIAGGGEIPIYFAQKADSKGIKVVSIAFSDEIDSRLQPYVEKHYSIGILKSEKILRTLKEEKVERLILLGKVEKSIIFQPHIPDMRTLKFLKRMMTHEDKTLLEGVIKELEDEGFIILDQKTYLQELFPEQGVLTARQPTEEEWEDVRYGMEMARKLADMEVGQTIVVKNKTVVAVEAAEGTDKALERGCALAKGKCVAVKVSRTNQDYRYDCPGVGQRTVETLTRGSASVLAIEADRVMMADRQEVVSAADRAGIAIVSAGPAARQHQEQ